MPLKKGKSNKKKKDNKEGGDKLTELDKEIFNSQIRNLEEKLKMYHNKYSEMESNCVIYKKQVEKVTSDKESVVAFLRNNLDQRADEIAELQERLDGLQKACDSDKIAHEKEVQQLKMTYQETKDQLTSDNIVLSGKLTSLEEFKQQKEELLRKYEVLNAKLSQQEADHRETVRSMEKHNIIEIDKLKVEMQHNLEEIAANFRRISDKQMSETTRRAIQENVALTSQVGKLKDRLAKVVMENQVLSEANTKQELHISTLEGIEKDFVKRNCTLLKVIKESDMKMKGHDVLADDLQHCTTKLSKMGHDMEKLQDEVKILKDETKIKQDIIQKLDGDLKKTSKYLESTQKEKQHLTDVISNATNTLKQALDISQESCFIDDDKTSSKEDVLNQLLTILMISKEIYQPEPALDKFQACVSMTSDQEKLSSRCILAAGDLGLVPRLLLPPMEKQENKLRSKSTQTEVTVAASRLMTKSAAPQGQKNHQSSYKNAPIQSAQSARRLH